MQAINLIRLMIERVVQRPSNTKGAYAQDDPREPIDTPHWSARCVDYGKILPLK